MNKQRLPGFNAEACLYKASRFYMARPAGASLSFNGEQVRPAQIGLVREPPGSIIPWPSNRPLPPWIQELQRQRECKLNARSSQCYSNCVNKYGPGGRCYSPGIIAYGLDQFCAGYAETCCIDPNKTWPSGAKYCVDRDITGCNPPCDP